MKPYPVKLLLLLLLLHITYLTYAQRTPSVKIEKGVPEHLANYRVSVLSNVRYTLNFRIPAEKSNAIESSEILQFDLKTNKLPLQLDFKEKGDHLKKITINGVEADINFLNEHIVLDAQYLKVGTNKITIEFIAGELSLNRNNDYLYTLLVPDRARTVFPCFDQPNIKAIFQLSLQLPIEWEAVSNAPLLDSAIAGDFKTYRYKESDTFSTYLFSFVAGRFEQATKEVAGREMRLYYRETDTNKIKLSVDTIFEWHGTAIKYLEDYTRIPFPFQKLDFVAIPDFQYGGMEHVGAIDYKASTLFLDSGATKDQENARSNLIAHETAHMWFGNLVTMRWFNDVWMKEVFANFMADKITKESGATNNYELKFLLTHLPSAYSVDRTAGTHAIRQPLTNLQEAGTLYGPIIYNKAPVMMRQLERLMGADAFRDGLREYLKKYSYGNASWPDLIEILDKRTPADLQAWNKVWVNTPGRPHFIYVIQQKNGLISRFTITQKGEQSAHYLLPQFFELTLVYKDHFEELTVNMNKAEVIVKEAVGKELPEYILPNSSGQGYGLFPVDENMIHHLYELQDATYRHPKAGASHQERPDTSFQTSVMRASAYINLFENMLNGNAVSPSTLMTVYLNLLSREPEELNLTLIAGQLTQIFWRFIHPSNRTQIAPIAEAALWKAITEEPDANKKKVLFRSYQSIALSKGALDTLYRIWKEQAPPQGVKLSEEDYTSLALNLAIKEYPDTTIIDVQQSRITNSDRKQRLAFLKPAVSADVKVRDHFFASLKELPVRKKESWVQDALTYLHHPLRTATSIAYLKESLDMLQEIQQTGDIFFPSGWLSATLGYYQSKEAADIVRTFLKTHPSYNPTLKLKILQAADPLFRAEKLVQKYNREVMMQWNRKKTCFKSFTTIKWRLSKTY